MTLRRLIHDWHLRRKFARILRAHGYKPTRARLDLVTRPDPRKQMARIERTPEKRRTWLLDIAAKKRALADEWDDYPDVADMYRADADIAEADAQAIPRSTP